MKLLASHRSFLAISICGVALAGCFNYTLPDLPDDQATDSDLDSSDRDFDVTGDRDQPEAEGDVPPDSEAEDAPSDQFEVDWEVPDSCGNGTVEQPDEECDGEDPRTCTTECGTEGADTCIACKWVCLPPPDTDCDNEDEDCDTIPDGNYIPTYTCGDAGCERDSFCEDGIEDCIPGTPEPTDPVDETFTDADCDGIDGEIDKAIFVATSGDDSNPGTMAEPKATIQAGIDAAAADETRDQVYVSMGEYPEEVTLISGVSVFGGYNALDGWSRGPDNMTSIVSPTNVGVRADEIDTTTVLGRLTVRSSDGESPGEASYGILVANSGALQVVSCTISAGSGVDGNDGRNGNNGEGYFTDPSARGEAGGSGCEYDCHCSSFICGVANCGDCSMPLFGAAGTGPCGRNGGNGGDPGGYVQSGQNGQSGNGGALGGIGGPPTFTGVPGENGQNGASPSFNSAWNGGAGNGTGTISDGLWQASDGMTGQRGTHGDGGGGGGGGGGDASEDCLSNGWCSSYGGAGGGGGAGGCGGYPGTAGSGGGGSFGILLINSTLEVHSCTIWTAGGGNGGRGGAGGSGGDAGPGGAGGAAEAVDQAGPGGQGGNGGNGARGGAGGGGGGGPSVGIALDPGSLVNESGNTYTLGPAGTGGASTGRPGQDGVSGNTYSF